MTLTATTTLDRAQVLERFQRIRARTRAMFDLLDESVYFTRPIALRNPIVFYEGHLPAFAVNTLLKRALGQQGVDARLEEVFARGIDPETEATAVARGNPAWPSRAAVHEYAAAADRAIEAAIRSGALEVEGHPTLHRAQALWTILEHEEMHQETLAYMWHQLPYAVKRKPAQYETVPASSGHVHASAASGGHDAPRAEVPAGIATLGTDAADGPFAWDNERPVHRLHVPAFSIDVDNVTNEAFMRFVEDGGYRTERWWRPEDWAWVVQEQVSHPGFWEQADGQWYWRAMFERVPLPGSWPVYVTWAEANAYANWLGLRLPTEAEFHRAAFADLTHAERRYPWGDVMPARPPANIDFTRWDPEPVGSHPAGASAWGVRDLVGNGWEWTATVFGPFDGFAPLASYPEYSADFFDGDHFVMKGASPLTARALTRRGFRNWFRPHYPYVYATFRCAASAEAGS